MADSDKLEQAEAKPVLFLSHAYADQEIAALLKRQIEACFPGAEIFFSSDPTSFQPGEEWVAKVLHHLDRARLVLVLATDRSVKRNWVWFEAGAGWARRSNLISCCLGRMHKGSLPAPLSNYTALNIGEAVDLEVLFDQVKNLGNAPRTWPDFLDLAARLRELERAVVKDLEALEDPMLEERWKIARGTIQDLDSSGQAVFELLLLYGSSTDYFMVSQVRLLPPSQPGTIRTVLPGLAFRTNLLQQVPGQPPDPQGNSASAIQWEIRPEFRPLVRRYFQERAAQSTAAS
jgi:hypothetical protein